MRPPYAEFVQQRFTKRAEGGEALLHSAIGMAGELVELLDAKSRENVIEELGDFEFYYEAARAILGVDPAIQHHGGVTTNLVSTLNQALVAANDFLDQAKKVWVYGKEVDAQIFRFCLIQTRLAVNEVECLLAVTSTQAQDANMEKLFKRYPTGYTDALALARKDKE
jgi:hypothetical protein